MGASCCKSSDVSSIDSAQKHVVSTSSSSPSLPSTPPTVGTAVGSSERDISSIHKLECVLFPPSSGRGARDDDARRESMGDQIMLEGNFRGGDDDFDDGANAFSHSIVLENEDSELVAFSEDNTSLSEMGKLDVLLSSTVANQIMGAPSPDVRQQHRSHMNHMNISQGVSSTADPPSDGDTGSMEFVSISVARLRALQSEVFSEISHLEEPTDVAMQVVSSHNLVRSYDNEGNKLLNEYSMISEIGRGSYGKVKLAVDTNFDRVVAIKIMNRPQLQRAAHLSEYTKAQPSAVDQLKLEVDIMRKFHHPNLVALHGVIDDPSAHKIYIIMEYMAGGVLGTSPSTQPPSEGDASTEAPEHRHLNLSLIRKQFLDILHGLDYLHTRNVIHMDIKPENVLLDSDGNCKLADFGVSAIMDNKKMDEDVMIACKGTPAYFAPCMLTGEPFHGKATDVWALGVTLYSVVYGRFPFHGVNTSALYSSILHDEVHCPDLHRQVPTPLLDVMYRMLCPEPTLRITVRQLLGHPFFTERVPLDWTVRMWKETRLSGCKTQHELLRLALQIKIVDTTDRSGGREVNPDTLMRTPLARSLGLSFSQVATEPASCMRANSIEGGRERSKSLVNPNHDTAMLSESSFHGIEKKGSQISLLH
eukprot:PhM_4_TR18853/c2_g2_i1/m.43423